MSKLNNRTMPDIGFRVFKIDSSNMKDVNRLEENISQEDMLNLIDTIKPDRTAEDLLFEVLLNRGMDLSLPIQRITLDGKQLYIVGEDELHACFDFCLDEDFLHP